MKPYPNKIKGKNDPGIIIKRQKCKSSITLGEAATQGKMTKPVVGLGRKSLFDTILMKTFFENCILSLLRIYLCFTTFYYYVFDDHNLTVAIKKEQKK